MSFTDWRVCLVAMLLGACAGDEADQAAAENAETAFDPLLESMDRAAEAGELIEARKQELDRALEQEE